MSQVIAFLSCSTGAKDNASNRFAQLMVRNLSKIFDSLNEVCSQTNEQIRFLDMRRHPSLSNLACVRIRPADDCMYSQKWSPARQATRANTCPASWVSYVISVHMGRKPARAVHG